MNKTIQNIALCRRASFLITGFDAVVKELNLPKSKIHGILTASDLSPKSLKEIKFHAEKFNKPVYEISVTMDEILKVLNKRTGILAVLDEGFLKLLSRELFNNNLNN